jgi:hypothetical protein
MHEYVYGARRHGLFHAATALEHADTASEHADTASEHVSTALDTTVMASEHAAMALDNVSTASERCALSFDTPLAGFDYALRGWKLSPADFQPNYARRFFNPRANDIKLKE